MVKKRVASKRRTKNAPVKRRIVRITSNPFLNFFLSVCTLKGDRAVERIARNAAVEWRRMNYLDKTPYYLLADEAKNRKRKNSKKTQQGRRYSDWDGSVSELPLKVEYLPEKIKSDSDINNKRAKRVKIDRRRKSEAVPRKESSESAALTSDVEQVEDIIRASEKNLENKRFWNSSASESSFGLNTSRTDSVEVMSSVSSITLEDTGRSSRRTHDFFY